MPLGGFGPTFGQLLAKELGTSNLQNVTNRLNLEGRTFDGAGRATDIPSLPIIPFVGVAWTPR